MELEREETKSVENVAQIKHRERNYMGMLEYRKEDEGAVMKALILGRLKQPHWLYTYRQVYRHKVQYLGTLVI